MALLTDQEKDRIEASVAAAETRTAAEIVVACVARSEHYAAVRLLFAVLMALSVSAALAVAAPGLLSGELLALQLGAGAAAYWLSGLAPLLRRLVPSTFARAAVERAAQLAFVRHSVFATRERTGVLILLSELEHRVAILGDEGIHARVKSPGWEAHVSTIVAAIRAGKAGEGVCQVVDALAGVLAEGAPIRSDDTNELHNRVRED